MTQSSTSKSIQNQSIGIESSTGGRALHFAAGASARLTQPLLDNSASVVDSDEKNRTPLFWACSRGCGVTVRMLLKNGSDPNAFNFKSNRPIHTAAFEGHPEAVCLLLDYRSFVDVPGHNLRTPLHVAAHRGNVLCVDLLLSRIICFVVFCIIILKFFQSFQLFYSFAKFLSSSGDSFNTHISGKNFKITNKNKAARTLETRTPWV